MVDPEEPGSPVKDNEARPEDEESMKKIRIDGVEYEVSDQVAQAFEKAQKKFDEAVKEAKGEEEEAKTALEKEKARADSAEAELAKEKKARTDAADPVRFQTAVKARVELERRAAPLLGAEVKLDGMNDAEVRKAVVAKLEPEMKLDGRSDVYVEALFDRAVAAAEKHNDGLEDLHRAAAAPPATGNRTEKKLDADEVAAKYRKDQAEAWKKPLTASKDR